MRKSKRLINLFLVITMLMSVVPVYAVEPQQSNTITRIGIISDSQLTTDSTLQEKLRTSLSSLANTEGGLDAIGVVGDLVDDGTVEEYRLFMSIFNDTIDTQRTKFTAVMGNHEFYAYGWGVSINESLKREMQGWFTEETGRGIEEETIVNGIHILAVSPDNEMDDYQNREAFLMEKIQTAAQANPQAPIIVLVHKPVKYTVMSSGTAPDGDTTGLAADWSDEFLEFMKDYPQIIYLSGHAHDDLGSENMIYQQDYTCIQTGVVAADISTGLLITVDADNVVTIERKNLTEGTNFEPSWVVDIPAVIEDKANFAYKKVNEVKNVGITTGEDQSEVSINWLNSTVYTGTVEYLKSADMIGDEATNVQTVTSYESGTAKDAGYYYNHAVIENLEPETEYLYRVGNKNGWSDYYTFTSGSNTGSFNFLLMGDPRLGAGESLDADTAGWSRTVGNALNAFPQASFIVTTGNQVNIAGSTAQYDGFFSPAALRSVPLLAAVGSRDYSTYSYSQYFSYPTVTRYGQTSMTGKYGADYSYLYHNALIMVLNTNNKQISEHRTFMQRAILNAGSSAKWKIVVFNHSIFGSGSNSQSSDITALRNELAPVFSDLNIDAVFMGSDYAYTRTYMMDGTTPNSENGVQSEITDPSGSEVVYITVNSSSGSQFNSLVQNTDYVAVNCQENKAQFSNVQITEDSMTITTYDSTDLDEVDSFAIYKAGEGTGDTTKPFLMLPTENRIAVGSSFNALSGVTATDNDGTDLTGRISCEGSVNVNTEGTYILTYSVTDDAGNTATATRKIEVVNADELGDHSLYYGIDVSDEEVKDEEGTIPVTEYIVPDTVSFVYDDTLNRTVLQMPQEDHITIGGLDIQDLDDKYTFEMYINIDRSIQQGDYEVFQFGNHNINLCALRDPNTYFGAGTEVDVVRGEYLPSDQWIHIVCTAKEGSQVIYVNAVPFGRDDCDVLGYVTGADADSNLYLGSINQGRASKIKVAYFRIYNGYSTANLVGKMYQFMLNEFVSADYTAVDEALDRIPEDLGNYTDSSVANLTEARRAVVRGKSKNEQQAVDEMAQAVNDAVDSLRRKSVFVYSITVLSDGNGTASANKESAAANETVTLTANPGSGYVFKQWQVVSGDVVVAGNSFTMRSQAVTIKAIFEPAEIPDNESDAQENESEDVPKKIGVSDINWSEESPEIKIQESQKIRSSVFKSLRGQKEDTTLTIAGENAVFIFNAGGIRSDLEFSEYGLDVFFNTGKAFEAVKAMAGNSFAKMISFKHSGELPGEAQIKFNVGADYAGKTLYYYYYNPATSKMEYMQAVTADRDGYITVTQSHCSDYVLVTQKLQESSSESSLPSTSSETQTEETDSSSEENPPIPSTGKNGFSSALIMALGFMGLIAAGYCLKKSEQ